MGQGKGRVGIVTLCAEYSQTPTINLQHQGKMARLV